jgi:hypothetical protein
MSRHRRHEVSPSGQHLFPCRYCLEDDSTENLIAPCICQGSMKYVHNHCLLRWYTLNPEIGLKCSVCKTECAYQIDNPLEVGLSAEFIKRAGLEHPFLVTFFYHWIYTFYCISVYEMDTFGDMRASYSTFQILFTGLYLILFSIPVWQVKQKQLYMQKWFCTSHILLPIFHVYCIWLIPTYIWIGGVGGNFCCFHYFYAHTHILEEMNGKSAIRFITRRQEKPPSSLEAS